MHSRDGAVAGRSIQWALASLVAEVGATGPTAATLWAAAAIGLASGLGVYRPAVIAAVLAVAVTAGLKAVERRAFLRRRGQLVVLTVADRPLDEVLSGVAVVLAHATVSGVTSEQGSHRVELRAKPSPAQDLPTLAQHLLVVPGVRAVDLHR